MNHSRLEQESIIVRLLKALSVLLLPVLLLVVFLSHSSQKIPAKPTRRRGSVTVDAGRQDDFSRSTSAEDPSHVDSLVFAFHSSRFLEKSPKDCYFAQIADPGIWSECAQPDLTINKVDDPDPVEPGGTLVYTITYSNIGDAVARDVVITDILPQEASFITASLIPTVSTALLVWDIGRLGAQQSSSIVVTTQVTSPLPNGHVLTNNVEIDCSPQSPASATTATDITSQPKLVVSKSSHADSVEPGNTLVYTISYGNIGTAIATGVFITDILPAGIDDGYRIISPTTFLSTTDTLTLVWKIPDLSPPISDSIVITVRVSNPLTNGWTLTNVVEMDCEQTDAVSDAITITVTSQPDLSITKSHHPDHVAPGNTFTYTIIYGNRGTAVATRVFITDILPAEVSYMSASVTRTNFITAANTLICRISDLHPPSSDSIVITVTSPLTDGLILTNVVEMDCQETDVVSYTTTTTSTYHLFYMPLVRRNYAPFCNGDFETWDFTCWAHGGELETSIQCGQIAYEGDCAALLGSPHYVCGGGMPIGKAWISQIFVPLCPDPSRPHPTLSFKYKIYSHERLKSDERDSFEVYINGQRAWRNPSNPRWESFPPPCTHNPWNLGWKESPLLDLSQYQRPITVSFHNSSRGDGWFNTYTYVDDVQVTCQP